MQEAVKVNDMLKCEPIVATEAFKNLLLSTMALLQVFGIWNLTDDQQAVIIAEYIAASVALSAFARSRVTPTANVALTHDQANLITAAQEGQKQ